MAAIASPYNAGHAAPHARAELDRGRADAGDGIIGDILEGIDRIVAHRPQNGAGVEGQRRPAEAAGRGGPTDERPPGERESEHELRPIGDPLHERINRDRCQGGEAEPDGVAVEAEQNREPDQRECDQEGRCRLRTDPSACQRSPARALDLAIEISIHEVVECRPRASHDDGTPHEERQMQHVRRLPDRDRREGGAPPARAEQQLPADGSVDARQLNIGPRKDSASAPSDGEAASGRLWSVMSGPKMKPSPRASAIPIRAVRREA